MYAKHNTIKMNYLLIDGSNMLHRSYYIAQQKPLINSKGEDTGTVFRFLTSLKTLAQNFNVKGENIYVAWDKKRARNTTSFRTKNMAGSETEYKGNRDPEKAKLVYANGEIVEQAIEMLGSHNFYPNVLEADDCISWLSKTLEGKKTIVSVDKDLMQLISEDTQYYNPIKTVTVTLNNFVDYGEVPIKDFVLYKAILGDKSDNVPGLDGYGKVKASRLAQNYNPDELDDEQKGIIERNIKMMDLSIGYKTEIDEEEYYIEQYNRIKNSNTSDFIKFEALCHDKEFKSITRVMSSWKETFVSPPTDLNDYMVKLFGTGK